MQHNSRHENNSGRLPRITSRFAVAVIGIVLASSAFAQATDPVAGARPLMPPLFVVAGDNVVFTPQPMWDQQITATDYLGVTRSIVIGQEAVVAYDARTLQPYGQTNAIIDATIQMLLNRHTTAATDAANLLTSVKAATTPQERAVLFMSYLYHHNDIDSNYAFAYYLFYDATYGTHYTPYPYPQAIRTALLDASFGSLGIRTFYGLPNTLGINAGNYLTSSYTYPVQIDKKFGDVLDAQSFLSDACLNAIMNVPAGTNKLTYFGLSYGQQTTTYGSMSYVVSGSNSGVSTEPALLRIFLRKKGELSRPVETVFSPAYPNPSRVVANVATTPGNFYTACAVAYEKGVYGSDYVPVGVITNSFVTPYVTPTVSMTSEFLTARSAKITVNSNMQPASVEVYRQRSDGSYMQIAAPTEAGTMGGFTGTVIDSGFASPMPLDTTFHYWVRFWFDYAPVVDGTTPVDVYDSFVTSACLDGTGAAGTKGTELNRGLVSTCVSPPLTARTGCPISRLTTVRARNQGTGSDVPVPPGYSESVTTAGVRNGEAVVYAYDVLPTSSSVTLRVYGPGMVLLGSSDSTSQGYAKTATYNAGAGTYMATLTNNSNVPIYLRLTADLVGTDCATVEPQACFGTRGQNCSKAASDGVNIGCSDPRSSDMLRTCNTGQGSHVHDQACADTAGYGFNCGADAAYGGLVQCVGPGPACDEWNMAYRDSPLVPAQRQEMVDATALFYPTATNRLSTITAYSATGTYDPDWASKALPGSGHRILTPNGKNIMAGTQMAWCASGWAMPNWGWPWAQTCTGWDATPSGGWNAEGNFNAITGSYTLTAVNPVFTDGHDPGHQGFKTTATSLYYAPSVNHTDFPTGNAARTMAGWVYLTSRASDASLFGYGQYYAANKLYILFTMAGTGRLQFTNWGAGTLGPIIPLNTWTHVAVSSSGNSAKIYVNGEQYNGDTMCSTLGAGCPGTPITIDTPEWTPFTIGTPYNYPASPTMGAIDTVRMYNRELTINEIRVLAASVDNQ